MQKYINANKKTFLKLTENKQLRARTKPKAPPFTFMPRSRDLRGYEKATFWLQRKETYASEHLRGHGCV